MITCENLRSCCDEIDRRFNTLDIKFKELENNGKFQKKVRCQGSLEGREFSRIKNNVDSLKSVFDCYIQELFRKHSVPIFEEGKISQLKDDLNHGITLSETDEKLFQVASLFDPKAELDVMQVILKKLRDIELEITNMLNIYNKYLDEESSPMVKLLKELVFNESFPEKTIDRVKFIPKLILKILLFIPKLILGLIAIAIFIIIMLSAEHKRSIH